MDATDMLRLLRAAGKTIEAQCGENAYHRAVGLKALRPGSLLFFPFAGFGHVATVVSIDGDPATDLGTSAP